jgi:hypothetical protein
MGIHSFRVASSPSSEGERLAALTAGYPPIWVQGRHLRGDA